MESLPSPSFPPIPTFFEWLMEIKQTRVSMTLGENFINVKYLYEVGSLINNFARSQRVTYNFEPVPIIQDYIRNIRGNNA